MDNLPSTSKVQPSNQQTKILLVFRRNSSSQTPVILVLPRPDVPFYDIPVRIARENADIILRRYRDQVRCIFLNDDESVSYNETRKIEILRHTEAGSIEFQFDHTPLTRVFIRYSQLEAIPCCGKVEPENSDSGQSVIESTSSVTSVLSFPTIHSHEGQSIAASPILSGSSLNDTEEESIIDSCSTSENSSIVSSDSDTTINYDLLNQDGSANASRSSSQNVCTNDAASPLYSDSEGSIASSDSDVTINYHLRAFDGPLVSSRSSSSSALSQIDGHSVRSFLSLAGYDLRNDIARDNAYGVANIFAEGIPDVDDNSVYLQDHERVAYPETPVLNIIRHPGFHDPWANLPAQVRGEAEVEEMVKYDWMVIPLRTWQELDGKNSPCVLKLSLSDTRLNKDTHKRKRFEDEEDRDVVRSLSEGECRMLKKKRREGAFRGSQNAEQFC